MYEIKTIRSADEIESGNVAEIAVYNWGGEYRPVSRAILAFIPDALRSPEKTRVSAATAALSFSQTLSRSLRTAAISTLSAMQTARFCAAMARIAMTAKR